MSENKLELFENHYLPCINWFKISNNETYIKIFANDLYKKMSFRNRCVVVGSSGKIDLSIPLEKGRDQKANFKDIKTSNNFAWQKQHWRTLESCYRKSPFWEYYADYFAPFYEKEVEFLYDFNFEMNQLLWRLVDKRKKVVEESLDLTTIDYNDVNIIGENILPKNYNVDNQYYVVYEQLFEERIGFQPNVSIIDLLCMEGPNTKQLLGK
jgi:hypothetical protein